MTVTGLDVCRITRGLALAPAEFTVAVPVRHGNVEGFRLGPTGERFELALDKRGEQERFGWCVFWMPFGTASGRCGIYSYRPQACATYPATLVEGEVARRADALCLAGSWGSGSVLASDEWRCRIERQRAEMEIDALVNRRWNGLQLPVMPAAKAFDAYLSWLLAVYHHLEDHDGAALDGVRAVRTVPDAIARALDAATSTRNAAGGYASATSPAARPSAVPDSAADDGWPSAASPDSQCESGWGPRVVRSER